MKRIFFYHEKPVNCEETPNEEAKIMVCHPDIVCILCTACDDLIDRSSNARVSGFVSVSDSVFVFDQKCAGEDIALTRIRKSFE